MPETNYVYKYPHSNDNSQYAAECQSIQAAGSRGIFDFRFSICDLIKIRKSQFANRKSQILPYFRLYLPIGHQAWTTEEMNITLNNEPMNLDGESITVEKLLEFKRYTFRLRIVKINGRLIDRDSYGEEVINDGDTVQVIYLMSGG